MTLYLEREIRDLLQREEGQFLEFKSLWDRSSGSLKQVDRRAVRDTIAECVAAFANADGGTLLLGVDDDGTPSGHDYPDEAIEAFLAVPVSRLSPPVEVRSQRSELDGKEIVVLTVNPSAAAVMVQGNGFPYRVGDRVVREPQEAINARKEAYRRVGFEQMVRPEASLADLDLDLARSILARTVRGGRAIEDALEAYGLAQRGPDGLRITNAGLLLFGRPPLSRWHAHADIRFFRVLGAERRHGARRNVTQLERLELPLVRLIPEGHRYATGQIRRSERLFNLFFKEIPEYPEFAWQETIVNAVAHRDYGNQGLGIEVWFYEDRMEIASPGTLVLPVTLQGLRERKPQHASRNPLIVRVLVEAGFMREEGEGIPRMFDETERVLLKPPGFEEEPGVFRVTLHNTPIFDGVGPEWHDYVDRLPLGQAQKRVLVLRPEGFTNQEYRELNHDVDRDQAYREIQDMVSRGIVLPPGRPGKGARYRLAPAIVQAKNWLEIRVPKLRAFFLESEMMQNSDYRELFPVSRWKASEELQRLVVEEYLSREGERRGARYRPGRRLAGTTAE